MDATPPPADAELAQLADVVWRERAALELLTFKLVALNLVLAADLRRFVGRCLDEVDTANELLDRVEARRIAALDAVCAAWDRPPGSLTLGQLAAEAPEPWSTVLADHRDHLRGLVAEVEHASAGNARLCVTTLDRIDGDLAGIGDATRRALTDPATHHPVATPLRLVPPVRAPEGSLA